MSRKDKKKAKINKDFLIIILLILIIFSLTIYILFSKMDSKDDITRKNFLATMQNVQSKLSYYVCEMEKDTFGIYSANEILSGESKKDIESNEEKDQTTDNEENADEPEEVDNTIKDNEGNTVTAIIDMEQNYGTDDNPIYKVNLTDLQKVLNVTVGSFEGIEWYVENGMTVKVGFQFSKPSWWNDNFDVFTIE